MWKPRCLTTLWAFTACYRRKGQRQIFIRTRNPTEIRIGYFPKSNTERYRCNKSLRNQVCGLEFLQLSPRYWNRNRYNKGRPHGGRNTDCNTRIANCTFRRNLSVLKTYAILVQCVVKNHVLCSGLCKPFHP
jgi:hypothetical protein